ncbi:MAG TPA: PAS domain S-box protein [Opitutaceae bacterium]|nr:PAS domain S-box protein [Opitutaceae bacterium]
MIRARAWSISDKLALALGSAAVLIFATMGLALVLVDRFTLQSRAAQILQPYARFVSVGAETAVAFEDSARAKEILGTLRANPQIVAAEIVLRDGSQLAGYGAAENTTRGLSQSGAAAVRLGSDTAELTQELHDGAQLHLVMGLSELKRQTWNLLLLFGGAMLVLVAAVTFGLRAALQRMFVRPVSILAKNVEQVRTGGDYRQRVPATGSDEFARLGEGFNAMLGAIQQREDDLRSLNSFQHTILDNAAYGIIAVGPDGVVTSFNRAAERLLGYKAAEVVGRMTPLRWHDPAEIESRAKEFSTELREKVPATFDVFAARARRDLPEEREWTFIRQDGHRVPVLLSITALRGAEGAISGFLGLTYDLTERKQAEEARRDGETRYRRIVDTAAEGICSLGADGAIVFVNARMAEMLGYSRAEMLGRSLSAFMAEEDRIDHEAKITERRRGISGDYERRFLRKTGEIVWVHASATPVLEEGGRFAGSFAMFTDITKSKAAEAELRRLKDELEQRVHERTNELESKNDELERMNRLFVGRELHMAQLKERLRKLEQGPLGETKGQR